MYTVRGMRLKSNERKIVTIRKRTVTQAAINYPSLQFANRGNLMNIHSWTHPPAGAILSGATTGIAPVTSSTPRFLCAVVWFLISFCWQLAAHINAPLCRQFKHSLRSKSSSDNKSLTKICLNTWWKWFRVITVRFWFKPLTGWRRIAHHDKFGSVHCQCVDYHFH